MSSSALFKRNPSLIGRSPSLGRLSRNPSLGSFRGTGGAAVESERKADLCRRFSPHSPLGCDESCAAAGRQPYRRSQKGECRITFIGKTLGKGTFGSVRQVYDRQRGVPLVLKTVSLKVQRNLHGGPYTARAFPFSEIDVMGRLRSCYTPALMDVIASAQCTDLPLPEETVGIAMPLAANSLKSLIDDESVYFEAEQLRSLIYSMALATYLLHENNFLHRDVKPANFLCTDDESSVFISDFGLSCRLLYPEETLSLATVEGTARFMAPETAQKSQYSKKSDCFSLGMSLIELIVKPSVVAPLPPLEEAVAVAGPEPSEAEQRDYLLAALARFGFVGDAPARELARRIIALTSSDPEKRGELRSFLALPIFGGLAPERLAVVIAPHSHRPGSWDAGALWECLSMAAYDEARWVSHVLVFDLAQRVVAAGQDALGRRAGLTGLVSSSFERASASDDRFSGFEAALFALCSVASVCPQLGLEGLANFWISKAALSRADGGYGIDNLMGRFVAMAASEDYILEDLQTLSAIENKDDRVMMHYLVMSPRYLELKGNLRASVAAVRQTAGLRGDEPISLEELAGFDLREEYRSLGQENEEIARAIADLP